MNRKLSIKKKLATLNPHVLEITNKSHLHEKHREKDVNDNESHFYIRIASDQLSSLSKIAAHKKINELLKEEYRQGLHSASISIITSNN